MHTNHVQIIQQILNYEKTHSSNEDSGVYVHALYCPISTRSSVLNDTTATSWQDDYTIQTSDKKSELNVTDSFVQGLEHAYRGTKVGLFWHTGAILTGCPSCCHQGLIWIPVGFLPRLTVRNSITLVTEPPPLLPFKLDGNIKMLHKS